MTPCEVRALLTGLSSPLCEVPWHSFQRLACLVPVLVSQWIISIHFAQPQSLQRRLDVRGYTLSYPRLDFALDDGDAERDALRGPIAALYASRAGGLTFLPFVKALCSVIFSRRVLA